MAVPVHDNRLVAPLQHVASPAVSPVKGLGVGSVEAAHAPDQVRLGGLEQQVKVVAHQAIGIEQPALLPDLFGQRPDKGQPVPVAFEDRLLPIPAGGDVIDGAREFQSEGPGHAASLRREACKV